MEKKGVGDKYLWKGQIVDKEEVKVSLQDRGYVFGDGLYEVARVYNGVLFEMDAHMDRLFHGAASIYFNIKYTREEIVSFFEELVKANDMKGGYVYFQITRGDDGVRSHLYPDYEDQEPVVSGFVVHGKRDPEKIKKGATAITTDDIRWKLCNVKTLNLIPNCMARHEAKEKGARKAILIKNNYVTEEKSGSILIVKDGMVITRPNSEDILPSITRKVIEELCVKNGIPYEERLYSKNELYSADEVICADTNSEICAILAIDGIQIGNGQAGPVTSKLQELYEEKVIADCGAAI